MMKKFIYSFLTFFILFAVFFLLISFYVKKDYIENDYLSAITFKHNRVDQLNGPKILFAGGSNLAFGLNSELVENGLSVPVVNLALHAGLGLDFILNELEGTIEKQDIVFLSIEYFLDVEGDPELKRISSSYFKEARKYFEDEQFNSIEYWFNYSKHSFFRYIDATRANIKTHKFFADSLQKLELHNEIYSKSGFNKYGDVISHLGKTPPKQLKGQKHLEYTYWKGIDRLNKFHKFAQQKEVAVFFFYPNYCESEYIRNRKVINKLSLDLSKDLDIEILNTPRDFVLPDSLFFDTVYHPWKTGREVETKKLIEIIKENTNALHSINQIKSKK